MENLFNDVIFYFFFFGIVSGFILAIDKYFMIRRYAFLATSSMYDLLLNDNPKRIEIKTIRKKQARQILAEKYDIETDTYSRGYINEFFSNNKVKDYSEVLYDILMNESEDEKTREIIKRFNDMKAIATEDFRFCEEDFLELNNATAYAYANMGYVIKLSLKAKYIKEKEAIKYLKKLQTIVENEYDDWLEYGVAYLTGKCIKSTTLDDELLFVMDYLLFNKRSIWNKANIKVKDRGSLLHSLEY